MTRMRMGLLLGLLLVLGLAVAGCGGGNKGGGVASLGGADQATTTTAAGGSSDLTQAALNYGRCLRRHGINVPDPKPDGGIDTSGTNTNDPRFTAAQRACQPLLPNAGDKQPKRNGGGG